MTRLYHHTQPCEVKGIDRMGTWVRWLHGGHTELIPSTPRGYGFCLFKKPRAGDLPCPVCGYVLTYQCGGSCNMDIRL